MCTYMAVTFYLIHCECMIILNHVNVISFATFFNIFYMRSRRFNEIRIDKAKAKG